MFGRKERKTPFQREVDDKLEAMRDDCIALFIDSGLSQDDIHERGGPTPKTISRWLYKETRFPRATTIISFVSAVGADLVVVGRSSAVLEATREARLGLDVALVGRPRMPRKKAHARA